MKKKKRTGLAENVPELLRELAALRTFVDESVEQFSLGVKARVDEIAHVLGSDGAPDAGHVLPDPRLVARMVKRLKSIGRHPTRGRVKDLKRIHDLISFLSEALLSRE
jgi:hypothetical protein